MYFRAVAGLVVGLCAGVVSGILFLVLSVQNLDGTAVPLLSVIAREVGSNDPSVGWSYHLTVSAIVGTIFGLLAGRSARRLGPSILAALILTLIWWAVSVWITYPLIHSYYGVGVRTSWMAHPLLMGTLLGAFLHGSLMGTLFLWVCSPLYLAEDESVSQAQQSQRLPSQNEMTVSGGSKSD